MTPPDAQTATGRPARKLPTVADLRSLKGKRQLTMLRYFSLQEARAAEAAGIDIASVPPEIVFDPRYRDAAPSVFTMTGQTHLEAGTPTITCAGAVQRDQRGADALYCSGSLRTVEYLAREHIPVVGHVGLVPARATWTGGFRAVGKTADTAIRLFEEVKAYESAGAIAVEIEVVPEEVATEISKRVGHPAVVDGGRGGLRCAISLCQRYSGLYRGSHPAPFQDLPRFQRRT